MKPTNFLATFVCITVLKISVAVSADGARHAEIEGTNNASTINRPSATKYQPVGVIPRATQPVSAVTPTDEMVDGTGDSARFFRPHGITADARGNLFVIDGGLESVVRKISPTGMVSTIPVFPARNPKDSDYERQTKNLFSATDIAVDRLGNLYVVDSGNSVIRTISPDGHMRVFAGQIQRADVVDGVGTAARIGGPDGITIDSMGNLFVTTDARLIRKITPAESVSTVAGRRTEPSDNPADGIATKAKFLSIRAITIDTKGNLYVVQMGGNDYKPAAIRKITPDGVVGTIVTSAQLTADLRDPEGMTLGGIAVDTTGNLYVVQPSHTRILKITPSGRISTFAGTPYCFGGIDGQSSKARFVYPGYITIDRRGNLFVTDHVAQTIRKISPTGRVSTLAGKNRKPAYDQEQCGENSYYLSKKK